MQISNNLVNQINSNYEKSEREAEVSAYMRITFEKLISKTEEI